MGKAGKTRKEKNLKNASEEIEPTDNSEPAKGYETLLRPIQDALAKDWKIRLANFLEDYLRYLAEAGVINFTEAAMIIQNSSSCYSKRVDIMYSWVRDFCITLSKDDETESMPNEAKTKTKKTCIKKKKGPLEDDELDRFDYSHTANGHRDPFETNVLKDLQYTLLNTGARAPLKPGAVCPVYQLNGEDMGYKDEFRVCWKLLGDGKLQKEIMDWENSDYDPFVLEDIAEEHLPVGDDNFERSMNPSPLPPENEPRGLSNLSLGNDRADHFSYEENVPPPEKSLKRAVTDDPYSKAVPLAYIIIHKKFKKSHVLMTEKEEVEGKKNMPQKKKKIKKFLGSNGPCHLSFSELLGGKSEDHISFRLRKRQAARLKQLYSIRKLFKKARYAPELNVDLDEDDNIEDFNDTLAFLRDGNHNQVNVSHFDASQRTVIENAYAESIRLNHLKRMDDVLTIQRRVADWHEMIQPALAEAEKRSEFDVHSYGTKILEQFNTVGEVKPLKELIKTSEYKEVCRYVLSALMMSNTYNVEIVKSDPRELAKDNINLKFLSSVRHHEELDANIGEAAATTH